MGYYWQAQPDLEPELHRELGLSGRFADQATAEAWLTENYPTLIASGVLTVALYEADRLVYGSMSLEP